VAAASRLGAGRVTFRKELRPVHIPGMALADADGGKKLVVTWNAVLPKEEEDCRSNRGVRWDAAVKDLDVVFQQALQVNVEPKRQSR
jgi:hypothetical protein